MVLLASKVKYIAYIVRRNNKIVFFVNKNDGQGSNNLICYKVICSHRYLKNNQV